MVEENKPNEKISFIKKRKKELILTGISLIIVIGITYAWLTQMLSSQNRNVLLSGDVMLTLLNEDPIIRAGGEDGYVMPLEDTYGLQTTPYTFTVKNIGKSTASYEISLSDADTYNEKILVTDSYGNSVLDSYGYPTYQNVERSIYYDSERIPDNRIKYNLREGTDTNTTTQLLSDTARMLASGVLAPGEEKTYYLRLWLSSDAELSDSGDRVFAAQLYINAAQHDGGGRIRNEHIKEVYRYNPNGEGTGASFTGCLGGAEAGCSSIMRFKLSSSTYDVGTVIKYEVKDGVYKHFNVIKDNGTTLTLQQRENTVNSKAWYGTSSSYTNANGPALTSGYALYELEQATADWTYVKDQTYSIGDNTSTLGYSGCSSQTNCAASTYTLSRTGVKARMITVQETKALGCTGSNMSCPKFMNNYLANNASYGGTFTGTNSYYWTMSANSSGSTGAWRVYYYGFVSYNYTYGTSGGARAVVVVEK